jgi:LysM repeat protein
METFEKTVRILLGIILWAGLIGAQTSPSYIALIDSGSVWSQKPVLAYFALTSSLAERMKSEIRFSVDQLEKVQRIAQREQEQLHALEAESQALVSAPALSLAQKQEIIAQMAYNQRVMEAVRSSQKDLLRMLGSEGFARLADWIDRRWTEESILHGALSFSAGARTYKVFASFYDSRGRYAVALPDQCVKLTNGGLHTCDSKGYVVGKAYDVYISYKKGAAVRVSESGPWNVDDNYWATAGDPTPRRMFADLPLGMPEAQAAYFNGYNGGKDQYGRKVTAPFGIDLSRQVAEDIGMQAGKNDWVNVAFLWTDGWGSGAIAAPRAAGTAGPGTPEAASFVPSTPNPDGSIVHIVQEGQSLWEIAVAYHVTLATLYALNGLNANSMIRPGDHLTIRPAGTISAQGILTQTATITPSSTPRPTRLPSTRTPTPTLLSTISPGFSSTEAIGLAASQPTFFERLGIHPVLLLVSAIILLGVILMLAGVVMSRRD